MKFYIEGDMEIYGNLTSEQEEILKKEINELVVQSIHMMRKWGPENNRFEASAFINTLEVDAIE